MSETVKDKTRMRAAPQRARGYQRVKVILDVAEVLFAEAGYEAATTNEIAARAGISIGSLYQYFPNKEAVLHALASRYRDAIEQMYNNLQSPEVLKLPLKELIDRVIKATVEFSRSHTYFVQISLQPQSASQLTDMTKELYHDRIRLLETILTAYGPHLTTKECNLYATVGLTAVNAVLMLALRKRLTAAHDEGQEVVEQARLVLTAYFESVLKQNSN